MYKYILFLLLFNSHIAVSMMHRVDQSNVSLLEHRTIVLQTLRSVGERTLQQKSLEAYSLQKKFRTDFLLSTITSAAELQHAYAAERQINEALIHLFQTTLEIPHFLLPYWEQIYAFLIEEVDGEEWQRMKAYFSAIRPAEMPYTTMLADFFEKTNRDILMFLRTLALKPSSRRHVYGKNILNIFRTHDYGSQYPFVRVMYLLFLVSEKMSGEQLLGALKDLQGSCASDLERLQMNGYPTSPLLVFCLRVLDRAVSLVNYCHDMDNSAQESVSLIINQQIDNSTFECTDPILAAIACTFWLRLQNVLCASVSSVARD